ncbi:MAG: hypothetical protein ACFFA6_08445 [Promethearchaeota archaeon]
MVLLVATVLIPHAAASKIAKKYIEMLKKYPPRPEISETIALGTRATKKGIIILSVMDVKKGKVEEAIIDISGQYQEYVASIEGLKWKLNTFMDMAEAYKAIGMEPPE